MSATLQNIHRRINMQHFEALSRIGRNISKTTIVAPWAAELTDIFEKQGLSCALQVAYVPTLLINIPQEGKPAMETLWDAAHKAGLTEWIAEKNLSYHGANGEYGGSIRIEHEADRFRTDSMVLDIAPMPKK